MDDIFHETIEPYARGKAYLKLVQRKQQEMVQKGKEKVQEKEGRARDASSDTPVGLFIVTRTYGDRFRN